PVFHNYDEGFPFKDEGCQDKWNDWWTNNFVEIDFWWANNSDEIDF
ncbi:33660_t:CDS:1, partial [Gigaspora margarita]